MKLFPLDFILSCVAAVFAVFGAVRELFSRAEKREKTDKIGIFLSFLILSSADAALRLLNGSFSFSDNSALALRSAVIAAFLWLFCLFALRVIRLSNREGKLPKIWTVALFDLTWIATILLLINAFTRFLFGVSEGNAIVFGRAFWVLPALEGGLWIAGALFAILSRKAFCREDALLIEICFAFFAAGAALDLLFPQIPVFALLGIAVFSATLAQECSKTQARFAREKEESERLRRDVARANEKLLQSQVSPHFIYNALTAIRALPNNPIETQKAIGDFASYLRQTLTTINENEQIPFEKELENVQAYLRLEKIRFGSDLNVVYRINFRDFEIPAMCVQILAENAVKHGVSVKRKGGTVRISTARVGDFALITVKDDGVGFDVNQAVGPSHVGIHNVKNRIRSIAGGEVTIQSEIGKGTTATIRLPLPRI